MFPFKSGIRQYGGFPVNGSERDEFDKKVLAYFKVKGTLCPNDVAKHFKKKWETAYNSIRRLVDNEQIYYHPDMGRSPMVFSIWPDHASQRYFGPIQRSEKGNLDGKSTTSTFDYSPIGEGIVRGEVSQIIEKEGFLCHPSMKGKDLPRTFIRGHLHGQYFVDVEAVGMMPETFLVPGTEITGGWMKRPMKGNSCYFGHVKFPEDRMAFKCHAMTDKEGNITGLSVYPHPRYFYYRNNEKTAAIEFRQQVKDVIKVLEGYGWKFGSIYMKGNYSMAINDPILASHVPTAHVESSKDSIVYDSSPMAADGVCTEAEVIADHEGAESEAELMVELPQRVWSMESKISSLSKNVDGMVNLLSTAIPHMENLTKTVHDLSVATEFNTTAIFGTSNPIPKGDTPYIAKDNDKGDAMYG